MDDEDRKEWLLLYAAFAMQPMLAEPCGLGIREIAMAAFAAADEMVAEADRRFGAPAAPGGEEKDLSDPNTEH